MFIPTRRPDTTQLNSGVPLATIVDSIKAAVQSPSFSSHIHPVQPNNHTRPRSAIPSLELKSIPPPRLKLGPLQKPPKFGSVDAAALAQAPSSVKPPTRFGLQGSGGGETTTEATSKLFIDTGPLSQDEFRIYFVSRLAQDGFYEETVPKILSQAEGRVTIDSSSVIQWFTRDFVFIDPNPLHWSRKWIRIYEADQKVLGENIRPSFDCPDRIANIFRTVQFAQGIGREESYRCKELATKGYSQETARGQPGTVEQWSRYLANTGPQSYEKIFFWLKTNFYYSYKTWDEEEKCYKDRKGDWKNLPDGVTKILPENIHINPRHRLTGTSELLPGLFNIWRACNSKVLDIGVFHPRQRD